MGSSLRFSFAAAIAFACASVVAGPARAVDGGAEADVVSRFVWRGRALGRGAALQPSLWASTHDVTASVWSNVALAEGDVEGARRVTAYVPSLVWERAFDAWTFSTGVFVEAGLGASGAPTTSEAALDVSFGGDRVRVASENRFDFGGTRGAYFGDLALSFEDEALGGSFRARASVAWGTADFNRVWLGVDRDALDFAALEIALRRALVAPFYLEAHAQLSALLPPTRSHAEEPTLVVAGLAAGFEL